MGACCTRRPHSCVSALRAHARHRAAEVCCRWCRPAGGVNTPCGGDWDVMRNAFQSPVSALAQARLRGRRVQTGAPAAAARAARARSHRARSGCARAASSAPRRARPAATTRARQRARGSRCALSGRREGPGPCACGRRGAGCVSVSTDELDVASWLRRLAAVAMRMLLVHGRRR